MIHPEIDYHYRQIEYLTRVHDFLIYREHVSVLQSSRDTEWELFHQTLGNFLAMYVPFDSLMSISFISINNGPFPTLLPRTKARL
jgi:hypothetical protein